MEDVLRYQLQSSRPTALPGLGELGLPDTLPAGSNMRGGNPVSAVAETFRSIDEPNGPLLPGSSTGAHGGSAYSNTTGLGSLTPTPDAIARGLITIEQAQRYFALYVQTPKGLCNCKLTSRMQLCGALSLLGTRICAFATERLHAGTADKVRICCSQMHKAY